MGSNLKDFLSISKTTCEKIGPIIKPLTDFFEIPTFGYRKYFLDGTSLYFSNNLSWTSFFVKNFDKKKIIPHYETEVKAFINEDKFQFFKIGVPDPNDAFLSSIYEHDIWNAYSFYKKTGDGIEGFYFASTRKNNYIIEEYINNVGLFERFAYYFKNKLFDILSPDAVRRLTVPTVSPDIFQNFQNEDFKGNQSIEDFLLCTPIQKFYLNVNGQDISISFQEFRTLALLNQGKTAKEIGQSLKISQRTVEDYIENIKHKLKTKSRSQLIDLFLLNFSHDRRIMKHLIS